MEHRDGGTKTLTPTSRGGSDAYAAPLEGRRSTVATGSVMVAVDISWDSRAALVWACKQAPHSNVPVTVLHVLHDPAEAPGKYGRDGSDPLAPMADRADKMLSELMAESRETHPELTRLAKARTKVVSGLPAQTIVDEALRLNASLIVVGSRGKRGLSGRMYGSTALKVVRLSPIPVTVVKDGK